MNDTKGTAVACFNGNYFSFKTENNDANIVAITPVNIICLTKLKSLFLNNKGLYCYGSWREY